MFQVVIERNVLKLIHSLSDKDQRVVWEHLERLVNHPNATGDIKKLVTNTPRWRYHISSKWTVFYTVRGSQVLVDRMMTREQAEKKYGRIL